MLTPDQVAYFDGLTNAFQDFKTAWKESVKVQNDADTVTMADANAAQVVLRDAAVEFCAVLANFDRLPPIPFLRTPVNASPSSSAIPFLGY